MPTQDIQPQASNNSLERLLEELQDSAVEEVALSQAFREDYAQLAITVRAKKRTKVLLVNSHREWSEISSSDGGPIAPNLVLRDNPIEYRVLVKPRWSADSLSAFVGGSFQADPSRTYQKY